LNKETWGIFNIYPDWRWGKFDMINPYRSLKKIYQKNFNRWDDVEQQIYEELQNNFDLK